MNKLSSLIKNGQLMHVPKMGKLFYLASLPFFVFMQILFNPKKVLGIIKLFFNCIKNIQLTQRSELFLNHRDLTVGNILINKNEIYLLDCGAMSFTFPG